MWRCLLVLCLIYLANCDSNSKKRKYKDPDSLFEKLSQDIAKIDDRAQRFCQEHDSPTKEKYGKDSYTLIVPLDEFNDANIDVRIIYRVIYIRVEDNPRNRRNKRSKPKRHYDDDPIPLEDVKILPQSVDPKKATWHVKSKKLEIIVPYKVPNNKEFLDKCNSDIDEYEFEVPYNVTADKNDQDKNKPDDQNKPKNKNNPNIQNRNSQGKPNNRDKPERYQDEPNNPDEENQDPDNQDPENQDPDNQNEKNQNKSKNKKNRPNSQNKPKNETQSNKPEEDNKDSENQNPDNQNNQNKPKNQNKPTNRNKPNRNQNQPNPDEDEDDENPDDQDPDNQNQNKRNNNKQNRNNNQNSTNTNNN